MADETRIAHIHVKTPGWIENVYVDFVGQTRQKGSAAIYDLQPGSRRDPGRVSDRQTRTEVSRRLILQGCCHGSNSLLASARQRLLLWDLSEAQIKQLDETGDVNKTITVYSPVTGYVTDRKAFPHIAVNSDTDIYTVADLSHVLGNRGCL